jgi:hypothetical protein
MTSPNRAAHHLREPQTDRARRGLGPPTRRPCHHRSRIAPYGRWALSPSARCSYRTPSTRRCHRSHTRSKACRRRDPAPCRRKLRSYQRPSSPGRGHTRRSRSMRTGSRTKGSHSSSYRFWAAVHRPPLRSSRPTWLRSRNQTLPLGKRLLLTSSILSPRRRRTLFVRTTRRLPPISRCRSRSPNRSCRPPGHRLRAGYCYRRRPSAPPPLRTQRIEMHERHGWDTWARQEQGLCPACKSFAYPAMESLRRRTFRDYAVIPGTQWHTRFCLSKAARRRRRCPGLSRRVHAAVLVNARVCPVGLSDGTARQPDLSAMIPAVVTDDGSTR